MKPGTQVKYIPQHIHDADAIGYPNGVQPGFVVRGPMHRAYDSTNSYFVRYWLLDGKQVLHELRTKANSELTPEHLLLVEDTVPQEWVDEELEIIQLLHPVEGLNLNNL